MPCIPEAEAHICVMSDGSRLRLLSLASQGGVDGGFPALCCGERSFVGVIRSLSPEPYRFSDSRDQPLRTTVGTWPLCMSGMNIFSEACSGAGNYIEGIMCACIGGWGAQGYHFLQARAGH